MIIDEIKKSNLQAMKDKQQNLRSIYSVVINKFMQQEIEARTSGKEVGDEDVLKIIQKTIKELEDESQNYLRVGNEEQVAKIEEQKAALEKYLPKMLTEQEIEQEYNNLADKTLPAVMRHFKDKYGAKVDLKIVSQIARR